MGSNKLATVRVDITLLGMGLGSNGKQKVDSFEGGHYSIATGIEIKEAQAAGIGKQ